MVLSNTVLFPKLGLDLKIARPRVLFKGTKLGNGGASSAMIRYPTGGWRSFSWTWPEEERQETWDSSHGGHDLRCPAEK